MNRLRSSSVQLPVGVLLLFFASCKGPSDEPAEPAEPPSYVSSYDSTYEAEAEVTPEPEQAPEAAADLPDSPAPPPPAPMSVPQSSASTSTGAASTQGPDLSSSERLDSALAKDADAKSWGVTPYVLSREALKPRVRDNYVFLLAGVRMLQDDAWVPVDEPGTGGINYLARGPGGWFHWDVAFSYGSENSNVFDGTSTVSLESTVWEIDFGITKIFALGSVLRPYIGIGGAYMRAGGQVFTPGGPIDDSDNTLGGYGRVGLAFDITDWGGLIGIDARYVAGTSVAFGPVDTDADGFIGSITFGYSW